MDKIYKLPQKIKYKMVPLIHFLLSLIIAVLVYPIFGWAVLMIFIGGVLIDVDHYLYYALKKKDLSLRRAYRYFVRLRERSIKGKTLNIKYPILIFHGIEFCIILLVLSIFSSFFWRVLIGIIIHLALDYTETLISGRSISFKLSQIYVIASNKHRKELS